LDSENCGLTTDNSLCLENVTRQTHSFYERRMGSLYALSNDDICDEIQCQYGKMQPSKKRSVVS